MKICHINLAREFRGGEQQTIALVEALAALSTDSRLEQALVVRRNSDFHSHCRSLGGFELRPVPPSTLRAAMAARDADIVHIHEGRSVRVGALLSLLGTPFLLTRRVPNRPKDFFLTRWVYSRAATIASVSDDVGQIMRDYVPTTPVTTVYDCVRPIRHEARTDPRANPDELRLAVIGEIDFAHKGQDIIVPAARILAERGSTARFLIAGSGRDESRLRDMAGNLANVELLGWVEDIATLFSNVDAVVHPARKEGLGSVLLEAMYCGKPVVAAAVGGITEIVEHERNGLLFEAESGAGLADAITRLEQETQLLDRLAGEAARVAQRFLPQEMARGYLEIYERLAGE